MNADTFVERRKMLRLCVTCKVEIARHEEKSLKYMFLTRDISAGGIQIHHSNETLSEGEVVDVRLFLPQQEPPVKAEAIVVWKRAVYYSEWDAGRKRCFDSGLKFTEIDECDLARIFQYIYEIGLHGISSE